MSKRRPSCNQRRRTLDVHERAELDLRGVVELPVHRCRAEDEVEQRALVDRLDLRLLPVMARAELGLRDVLGDDGGEPPAEAHRAESRWSCTEHDVRREKEPSDDLCDGREDLWQRLVGGRVRGVDFERGSPASAPLARRARPTKSVGETSWGRQS